MSSKQLSKLQIRAEILAAIQHLYTFDEIPKSLLNKYIENLKLIENRAYVIEVLIKELLKYDYHKSKIISGIISGLGTLEQLGDILWSYIKDPNISDDIKNSITLVLKALGDDVEPENYLVYFQDPGETIEKETKRLLEISYVNPEAQIDFMDFMFSLPIDDQKSLVYSLKEDYPSEYLANILVSILESSPDHEVKKVVVKVLGETKASIGVNVLKEIHDSDPDEQVKKIARKSLNTLKLAGIDINKPHLDKRGDIICQQSFIYECYASCVDGMGNQGLIISRIKPSNDVIMFSVVINDIDGIIDCFGFNGISKYDFGRIITKFQENSTRVIVPPEYCKQKLIHAKNLNKKNGEIVPYEFIAWSALIYDFPQMTDSIEQIVAQWEVPKLVFQSESLYKYPGFKYWFLDDNDHEIIKKSLANILEISIKNQEYFCKDISSFINWLNEEVLIIIKQYFNDEIIQTYQKRLIDTAYLLDMQELTNFRNMVASVAAVLKNPYVSIEEIPFFKEMIKKTIYEGFIRHQNEVTNNIKSEVNACNNKTKNLTDEILSNIPHNDVIKLIHILETSW